jgi:hypothetical protein
LELVIGQFIGRLVFLIIFAILLNGVIGEMHIPIAEIGKVELLTAGPDIPILIPKTFENPVDSGQQHVVADIELAVVVQEGPVYVGLDDIGKRVPVRVLLSCHALLDLAEGG